MARDLNKTRIETARSGCGALALIGESKRCRGERGRSISITVIGIYEEGELMSLKRIRACLDACKIDNEILQRSRVARVGNRAIQLAVILRAVEPALLLIATAMLIGISALAADPGGDIFGGSDQTLGNGVREAIRWGRNLLFLLGVGGAGWGTLNYMTEKAYMKQFIGGGLAMSLGGIASLIYSFSQGNAVDLDTDLGN